MPSSTKSLFAALSVAVSSPAFAEDVAALRYIVHFADKATSAEVVSSTQRDSYLRTMARSGDAPGEELRHVGSLAVGGEIFEATTPAAVAALSGLPGVVDIEEDLIVIPTAVRPALWHRQWYMHDPRVGIDAEVAWRYTRGAGATVAVLDSGITPHPQLDGQVLPGYDFVSSIGAARDGDGRDADPADEGDWADAGDCGPRRPASASSWHGTHVAGLIAAHPGRGTGMVGVAPEAKVVPVRVMGRCGGRLSDVVDAIVWASGGEVPGVPSIDRRVDVINLSLGAIGACGPALKAAVAQARSRGTALVVAAGNDSLKMSTSAPANCPGVVSVAALDRRGGLAWYSNHGEGITLAAPGGSLGTYGTDDILSTVDGGARGREHAALKYYAGTSMAAPQVAALVALMRSADPEIGVDAITQQLIDNARPLPGPCPKGCGAGLMDAGATVDAVVEDRGTYGTP